MEAFAGAVRGGFLAGASELESPRLRNLFDDDIDGDNDQDWGVWTRAALVAPM